MYFAIGVEPTKETACTSGCSSRRSTTTLSPFTTLRTPSGRPASFSSSATYSEAPGSFSDGFRMNVFPHAIAFANIHMGTIAGKLNGVMPATTPSGCRIENTSTPVDACSVNPPFNRCGIPVANSMFSWPRATSPIASDRTFPCCSVISRPMSLRCSWIVSRIRNRMSARLLSEVARQPTKASRATSIAASTSSTLAKSTSWLCSPVAGLNTGPRRPDSPVTGLPPIQWLRRSIGINSQRGRGSVPPVEWMHPRDGPGQPSREPS